MPFHPAKLTSEVQAAIYFQLARIEDAGLSAQQAFKLLDTNTVIDKHLEQFQKSLQFGLSISESGLQAGVFNKLDKDLLVAGETAGNMGIIYRQLADYYDQKAKCTKKIKSQLYLPSIIVILAHFVRPLPAFILNEISGWDYFISSFGKLSKVALLLYVVLRIPFWLTEGPLKFLGMAHLIYQMQLKLPYLSTWVISRQINAFFRNLALMLKAGMPILEVLPKAINTIKNPLLKKKFLPAISLASQGQTLTESLTGIEEIDRTTIQWLLTGESSGKLAETMLHFSQAESKKHGMQEQLLAEWMPRLVYSVVIFWVAASIIGNNLFSDRVL